MPKPPALLAAAAVIAATLSLGPLPRRGEPPQTNASAAPEPSIPAAVERMAGLACASPAIAAAVAAGGVAGCRAGVADSAALFEPALAYGTGRAIPASVPGDGSLLGRVRLATLGSVGIDFVAYLSSGLAVAGVLCFPDDGQPHSTVIHLHGGFGGTFVNPDGGDILGTCYRWAADHGRTAFVPSFRGQDGGQGQAELCLGEADDTAAAAILLRGLETTDPDRMALVGGSMGGCVALKAGVLIPNLRAVVAIAPPTDFASYLAYHRTSFAPAVETRCDGSTVSWNDGGPAYADTVDEIICGHPGCSDAEYAIRSPLLSVASATNPTLVIAAGGDNLVPPLNQVLWSALRNTVGGSVVVDIRDRCSAAAAPALEKDVLLYVPGGFHLLENDVVISGLLYLIQLLDAPGPGI